MNLVWLRRDLRLDDHKAIEKASENGLPIQVVFIFDPEILNRLKPDDPRVNFIHQRLSFINQELADLGASVKVVHKNVINAWEDLLNEFVADSVYFNYDFEPYAIERDQAVVDLLKGKGISYNATLDHLVFKPTEILKEDKKPYTVYTPYKNKWLKRFEDFTYSDPLSWNAFNWSKSQFLFPSLQSLGFTESTIEVEDYDLNEINGYAEGRDFPAQAKTTKLGPHLRFGTLSIRSLLLVAKQDEVFLSELIWREFFTQIIYHFPHVVHQSFKSKYEKIPWENDEHLFELWKQGKTGYPLVDAGIRELNATGYMHNRVRMVVASFLIKHLLIDWRWGEAYFAEKLLDFELASNNGNWQWAAGCGCDAAPYFRVFNPTAQQEKFDENMVYIRKWVPEVFDPSYPKPIVEHKEARLRAIEVYKKALTAV